MSAEIQQREVQSPAPVKEDSGWWEQLCCKGLRDPGEHEPALAAKVPTAPGMPELNQNQWIEVIIHLCSALLDHTASSLGLPGQVILNLQQS